MITTLMMALIPTVEPVAAAGSTSPPFTQCPADGLDKSCAILILVANPGTSILIDSSQPPLDGVEDTLFGVQNNSSGTLYSLPLRANTDLFGFEGDGLCGVTPRPTGCPFGPTLYEGPGISFSSISSDAESGVVIFANGIPSGGTAYFSLEEALQGTVVSGNLSVVQDFKQNSTTNTSDGGIGGSWASQYLTNDKTCGTLQLPGTIANFGCALTSLADVAFSYGVQSLQIKGIPTPLDPGSLNQLVFLNNNLQDADNDCFTDWQALSLPQGLGIPLVTNKYGSPVVVNGIPQIPASEIQAALNDGALPIVHIATNKDAGHWVVVYQASGTNEPYPFRIVNPFFGNIRIPGTTTTISEYSGETLSSAYPNYAVTQMEVYKPSANPNFSGWSIDPNTSIQLLVTDSSGRQTGYIASSSSYVENIPGASYVMGNGVSDPTGINPSVPDVPYFEANTPADGTYLVEVIGTGSGTYTLDFTSSSAAGSLSRTTITGTATPGSTSLYQVTFSASSGGSIQPVMPTTTALITGGTVGTGGWYSSSVTVSLNATEIPLGPGVQSITYSATGAQPIPSTTVQGTSASIPISTEGQTTLTFAATDKSGNVETPAKTFTVKIDRTAPSGTVSVVAGPPKQAIVAVQDAGSGLASIQVTESINATSSVAPFTPGTTQPVQVAFTKVDQTQGAAFALTATDVAGNSIAIDPADVTVDRATGKPVPTTVTGIQGYERTVAIQNGTPGLTDLDVAVNGKHFKVARPAEGATTTLDIGSALQPGGNNTVVLTPKGKPGGSAEVVISGSAKR